MTVEEARAPSSGVRSEQSAGGGGGQPFVRPSQKAVIRAIQAEALSKGVGCDRWDAHQVYGLMLKATRRIRKGEYKGVYHVTQDELNRLHPVMNAIMPDDVLNPTAGSAHDMLNRHLLRGSEFSLVHTKDAHHGVEYCAVAIELRTY